MTKYCIQQELIPNIHAEATPVTPTSNGYMATVIDWEGKFHDVATRTIPSIMGFPEISGVMTVEPI